MTEATNVALFSGEQTKLSVESWRVVRGYFPYGYSARLPLPPTDLFEKLKKAGYGQFEVRYRTIKQSTALKGQKSTKGREFVIFGWPHDTEVAAPDMLGVWSDLASVRLSTRKDIHEKGIYRRELEAIAIGLAVAFVGGIFLLGLYLAERDGQQIAWLLILALNTVLLVQMTYQYWMRGVLKKPE